MKLKNLGESHIGGYGEDYLVRADGEIVIIRYMSNNGFTEVI